MRKILISMLLASAVATPALAGPREDRQAAREQARTERSNAREERSSVREERSTASTREERTSAREDRATARTDRVQMREQRQTGQVTNTPVIQRNVERNVQRNVDRNSTAADVIRQRAVERNARPSAVTDGKALRDLQRKQSRERLQQIREAHRNSGPPPISNTPSAGTQPPPPTTSRPTTTPTWNTSWRHDSRYDWSRYRRHHSWLFNLGFYYDPFGWGYYPYSIGWRMWPSYYSSSFWLNDPWQYRLPYAPPGTRWIRYYDDAILVDMWSGQVIDVIYDFFW